MPRTRKDQAPVLLDGPEMEGRYVDLGDYTVAYETFHTDADPAPLFRGLPDDRCQCPHWGVVVSGKVIFRYADHDEVYEAGDAFYAPPGHVPLPTGGTTLVEFSPVAEKAKTDEVIGRNMQAGVQAR